MNDNFTITNDTASTSLSNTLEFRIFKISIYVVIFILTIVGNVLVITVIKNDPRMRSSSHILVLNLAICDLITPTISLPFDLAYEELQYHWPFGVTMCKILWPAQTFSTTSSVLILTAICIDRYRALVYPFKVRWAGKFCFMICAIYCLSIAVIIPYVLVLRRERNGDTYDCVEEWPRPQKKFRQAYTILLCLLQYALPLVLMITLYSKTLKSLYDSSKSLPGMVAGEEISDGENQLNPEAEKRIHALKEQRKEQHLKVTKMFITVVIVFAISMFPNQVLWLWVDFGNLSQNRYFSITSIVCRIFTYSNSVLNPFIYGLYSKDFRKGYQKAGKKLSTVHRHTAFYFPQGKKGTNSFNLQGSYHNSEARLISMFSKNGSSREASLTEQKRVQFSNNSMNGHAKPDTKQLKEKEYQKLANKLENVQERKHLLSQNSNVNDTALQENSKTQNDKKCHREKDSLFDINYNAKKDASCCRGDSLDKSFGEYLDELPETSC